MSGDVSDVEIKTDIGAKKMTVANFYIAEDGARFRCAAWGDLSAQVPSSGRVLLEGRVTGRQYEKDGQTRTSTEITVSTIERLAASPEEDDLPD